MGIGSIVNRLLGRQGARAQYDAARVRRRLSAWNPSSNSMRAMLSQDGSLLRDRARDLVRNNPYASAAADSFVSNLVGAGIKPSSLVTDPTLRDQIQKTWLAWTDEADADGVADFYGLQAIIARSLFEAGECFVRFRPRLSRDGLTVPLQLQVLESDLLDYSFNTIWTNGNEIVNGVEFDGLGRRVAYHFWKGHPGDLLLPWGWVSERVRVPASEVLHIFKPLRPGQVRGASLVAPAAVKLWQLDQYDDAELDRKKTAAMYAGFITSPTPDDVLGDVEETDSASAGNVALEPGTMQALLPGEDVKFSTPAEVGGSYEAFQYRNLLSVFSAMGVPYALGTGDMRKANYSSLRGAIVEYRRKLEQAQHNIMVYQLCRPVWQRWLDDAVFSGALKIPGYAQAPAPFRQAKWIPPKFDWVDPYKDRQAELVAVQAGFKSRSDVIEAEGSDPEEVDRRIAADHAREIELGLVFNSTAAPVAAIPVEGAADGDGGEDPGAEAA